MLTVKNDTYLLSTVGTTQPSVPPCLSIQRCPLAPNGDWITVTCQNLDSTWLEKASSVWQWAYESMCFASRPLIKLTWINVSYSSRRCSHGSLTWQVAELAPGRAERRPCGAGWRLPVGPRPPVMSTWSICSCLSPFWHIFILFPAYK
jgi:hypothetical protein